MKTNYTIFFDFNYNSSPLIHTKPPSISGSVAPAYPSLTIFLSLYILLYIFNSIYIILKTITFRTRDALFTIDYTPTLLYGRIVEWLSSADT